MKTAHAIAVFLAVIPMVIMSRYPFIKDMTITSTNVDPATGYVTAQGTMKVMFTNDAWTQFGYKDDNFYWFNKWWQEEAPGITYGPFRIVSATWTLVEHTENYDKLEFTIVLAKAHGAKTDFNLNGQTLKA
jgi:hypothetical protein